MKILVVFTGGTIGSSQKDGFVSTDSGKPYRILELYKSVSEKKYGKICWETASPYEELSENLTCSLLGKLIIFLRDNCIEKDYDGIIVTHGTDTLQYTAAALSYCFGDLSIPIVLVSSNYILEDSRANGVENFARAVDFIEAGMAGGVFVSYRMAGECAKIHCGTRVLSHMAYSDAVESLYGMEYAYFDNGGFKPNPEFPALSGDRGICKIFRDSFGDAENNHDTFSDVVWIRPYVGMHYQKLSENVKAVLHDSYHSGTICSKSEDLERFAEDAKIRQIPVFVCGCGDSAMYESKKIYDRLGFIVLPVASPLAMYMKLWLCVKSGLDLKDIMTRKICE